MFFFPKYDLMQETCLDKLTLGLDSYSIPSVDSDETVCEGVGWTSHNSCQHVGGIDGICEGSSGQHQKYFLMSSIEPSLSPSKLDVEIIVHSMFSGT